MTCCKEVIFPSLCFEVGEDAAKLIPWRCYTKDEKGKPLCDNCGIEKKLGLSNCPALLECEIAIPVLEWKLAQCPCTNMATGLPKVQIKLSENDQMINVVLQWLKEHLERCPGHYGNSS
jgi:hypothetical protein